MFSLDETEAIKKTLGLKTLSLKILEKINNPSNNLYSSRTHFENLTLEVTTEDPFVTLGVDAEKSSRVTDKVLKKIKKESDDAIAQNSFLWVAKEAAFKALQGPSQPTAFSLINIKNWSDVGPFSLFTFQWKERSFQGIVIQKENITYAFTAVKEKI